MIGTRKILNIFSFRLDLIYLYLPIRRDDVFESVFSTLGIKAKGSHYDRLFKNFYLPEKKLCGYTNILK